MKIGDKPKALCRTCKERWRAVRDQRQRHRQQRRQAVQEQVAVNGFLDRIAPAAVQFWPDHYICGSTYRCVWALREYPPSTDAQAILRHLGEKDGVTLHIYLRQVTPAEERKILHNAANRHRLARANTDDLRQAVTAQDDLQQVADLVLHTNREREPLVHCAVYIGLCAPSAEALRRLQAEVQTELVRAKLNVDRLLLCQQEGFACVSPVGANTLGAQFERVMPASSAANLYPFGYSGKTDARGFYIGRDRYGSSVLVDLDQRDADKTSANILILGNSGQGKSYLMKLLLLNLLESGKSVLSLDAEHEQREMCEALGGCFIDLMAGRYRINVLQPKCWDDGSADDLSGEKGGGGENTVIENSAAEKGANGYNVDGNTAVEDTAPPAFQKSTRLAQHISFLKDFFRAYKDFSDAQLDVIELMLTQLYARWGISEETDLLALRPQDYPILSDLYALIEQEYHTFSKTDHPLYTQKQLQEILLGLHSLCRGADARFFDGYTNISSGRFVVFGVRGLPGAAQNVRNAMLFNILSYMSDKLLVEGNTVAVLDELYLWLSNPTAIEYIRNALKRVRKRGSAMLLSSQNLEDFDRPNVREMTRPLFAIPPHQFLFNPGAIDGRAYREMLQLDEAEYDLIRFPQRGVCLYKCGNERYLLEVHAPPYKEALFGTAGGR